MRRFLIDDQGRTTKMLRPLDISPTLRREMHGNEPRVVEPIGWQEYEKTEQTEITKEVGQLPKFNPFKYVSLFSGIGGFEMALDKLGGQCVLASEIDKFARQAYEVLYGMEPAGDVTKIDADSVPDHDMLVGGFPCFVEGTLITTADGLKPIEDIRKSDRVLTHKNRFKDVVIPMVKRKKGIYRLKVQGSPETLVTEEHPYYVREMARVWDHGLRRYVRTWSAPKWVEAKNLKPNKHFVGFSENTNEANPHNITEEEAWLLGRYVADGYVRNGKRPDRQNSYNNQVIYCVGKNKLSEFKSKIKSYYLGISEERTVFKVRIIDERFCELAEMCGRGSENKEVPTFVLDLPKNLLRLFLEGYLSGDGSVRKGVYSATSVSKKLIFSLGQATQKVYNTPYSITYTKRPEKTTIEGRVVNQKDTWTIRFSKESRKQNNGVYIDGMLWMPVRRLTYDPTFEGNVFNFEVADDNSYVANNCTVHNCQAFSVAGKRLGFEDTRGTLFFEIARIAKAKKPRLLLLENVKGLVSHDKGRTLDTIVTTLNDIGYTVDFAVLNSKYFGVPQNRERIFIVGVLDGETAEWDVGLTSEGRKRTDVVAKAKRRIAQIDGVKTFNFDWPEQTEVTVRLRDILEDNVDEKYYLSEEKTAKLVAQLEDRGIQKDVDSDGCALVGRVEIKGHDQKTRVYSPDGLCPTPSGLGVGGNTEPKIVEETASPQMLGLCDIRGNESIRNTEGISPTLTTMGGGHREPKIAVEFNRKDGIGRELDVAHTLNSSDWRGLNRNQTQNAVVEEIRPVLTPDRVEKRQNGRRFKDDGEESFTLTAQDRHGVAIGVRPRYRIRKLTPLECWRLQGFPDLAHEAVKAAGISDSQRYKMAGNAVTVNVIEAIGVRLLPLLTPQTSFAAASASRV